MGSSRAHKSCASDSISIGVLCVSDAWGGLEQVAVDDAVSLAQEGVETSFICAHQSPALEHLEMALAKDRNLPLRAVSLDFKPRNTLDLSLARALRRLYEGENGALRGLDLLHTHQTSLLGSIVPSFFGHPGVGLIATRHIMNRHDKKDFFHRAIYSRIDAMLVMSEALRQNVLETHAISPAHVKTINLGLDFSRFDPKKVDASRWRQKWGAQAGANRTLVVGLVGRIDPAKGQATFIRAAARLAAEGFDLKFVIVGEETKGSDAGHLEELKTLAKEMGLEKQVYFEEFQEDIPPVMGAFDIFVMPSREEAFGLVAIEAMAMGVPVILTNRGSAREIAGPNEEYGLLIRPDDAFDLQQKLRTLIGSDSLRHQMGQEGRAHVLQLFDRKRRVERTLETYDRVLKRRGPLKEK